MNHGRDEVSIPAIGPLGPVDGRNNVKQTIGLAAALLLGALSVNVGHAQSGKSGIEKLYILNCGEGVAGDISRWSPGLNEGKSMDFVDNCYLIKHAQGWFLWDTGVTDADRGDAGRACAR